MLANKNEQKRVVYTVGCGETVDSGQPLPLPSVQCLTFDHDGYADPGKQVLEGDDSSRAAPTRQGNGEAASLSGRTKGRSLEERGEGTPGEEEREGAGSVVSQLEGKAAKQGARGAVDQ